MPETVLTGVVTILRTISQILAAGIAITAFSLLLYSFGFNLKDRVTRSFTIILFLVMVVFTTDAIGSAVASPADAEFWLRLQWVGIVYIPPAYIHFSDALLATTGQPSRGKRKLAILFTYLASSGFLLLIPLSWLIGPVVSNDPASFLARTPFTDLFTIYFGLCLTASWINFIRAFRRTRTRTSRRRLAYLLAGSIAPALGSFPYLLYGAQLATGHHLVFWGLAAFSNFMTGTLIVVMAYSIAFYGVFWPDRVVKRRLFKWLMRGPVTALIVLAVTTVIRRAGSLFGVEYTAVVPLAMVILILVMEYAITIFSPIWERFLFYGKDHNEVELVTEVSDRLMTTADLHQFLETALAALMDRTQSHGAFVVGIKGGSVEVLSQVSMDTPVEPDDIREDILPRVLSTPDRSTTHAWKQNLIKPLYLQNGNGTELAGLLGLERAANQDLDPDQSKAVEVLSERISLALSDRDMQTEFFAALEKINPAMENFQRMRAAGRFGETDELLEEDYTISPSIVNHVREALIDYWGGPRLSNNPLTKWRIVQKKQGEDNSTTVNALRAILQSAVEQVKPAGERKYTTEWILYNILDLKFLQGRRVREVAQRLSISEADLYRKQRIAIEAVAKIMYMMEIHAGSTEPER